MSACAMRMCSTTCQIECANPGGTTPRSFGGIPLMAVSNDTCAFCQSRHSASNPLSPLSTAPPRGIDDQPSRPILHARRSQDSDHVRARDDERLVGLEIAH